MASLYVVESPWSCVERGEHAEVEQRESRDRSKPPLAGLPRGGAALRVEACGGTEPDPGSLRRHRKALLGHSENEFRIEHDSHRAICTVIGGKS